MQPGGEVADIGAPQHDFATFPGDCRDVGDVASAHRSVQNLNAGKGGGGGQER